MDILIGIKAEQSLRDAVRTLVEQTDTEIELTPVGRKDWIAGERVGDTLSNSDMEDTCRRVHRKLMALGSEQRIRFESIKLYSVAPPVPVFKDPDESDMENDAMNAKSHAEPEFSAPVSGPSVCPVCNRSVHSYNLHYSTDGKVVGCFMCGGNKSGF